MARRKQNPINDIVDTVGAWLGGSRGAATNPQVRAAMDATRAVGKVVDTATGGFGQAAVDDARRMAASGSSTPSALYKTAAVNLAAAAAGVGTAAVVGKVAKNAAREVGVHLSNTPGLRNITYSPRRAGTGFGRKTVQSGQTYKFSSYVGKGTEEPMTNYEFARSVAAENVNMATKAGMQTKSRAYVTTSKKGSVDPDFGPWSTARTVSRQRVAAEAVLPVSSPQSSDVEEVRKQIYSALVRQQAASQRNIRSAKTAAAGVAGVVVQQSGLKKARGGGRNKK